MPDGYTYVIELVDQISGPAKTAGQQIDKLANEFTREAAELKKLQAEYAKMQASETRSVEAEEKLYKQIQKSSSSLDSHGDQLRKMVKDENDAQHATGGLGDQFAALGAESAAFVAVALAVVAVLGALIIGGAAIALDAAHFKQNTIDALKSVSGSADEAKDTYEYLTKISDEVGMSNAHIQKLGLSLLDAGVKGDQDLSDGVKSIALLEKVRGEEAGHKLQNLIEKSAVTGKLQFSAKDLKGTGINEADVVAQLAKDLGQSEAAVKAQLEKGQIDASKGVKAIQEVLTDKLGGDASGFETASDGVAKIYEKFTRLFEDVNVQPLLDALKEVAGWLDKGTVAGDALHWLFTTVFNEVFALIKEGIPYAKALFLEMVIGALKIYIAIKPLIKQFEDLGAKLGITGSDSDALATALTVVVDIIVFLARVWIGWISWVLTVWGSVIDQVKTLGDMVTDVAGIVVAGFDMITDALSDVFGGDTGSDLAMDLINGLISGFSSGGPLVSQALGNLGQQAIDSIRNVLGTHSPSTEMMSVGDDTVDGFVNQVEKRAPDAQGTLANVVTPPDAATAGAGGAGGGAAVSVTISPGAVTVSVGAGAAVAEIQAAVEAAMANMVEAIVMQFGGATPEGSTP